MSEQGHRSCRVCEGAGQEVVGEYRVTRDMAIDAGEPDMEGMFHSYAWAECEACGGSGLEVADGGEAA